MEAAGLEWPLEAKVPHSSMAGDQLGGGKAGRLCTEGWLVRPFGSIAVVGFLALA